MAVAVWPCSLRGPVSRDEAHVVVDVWFTEAELMVTCWDETWICAKFLEVQTVQGFEKCG